MEFVERVYFGFRGAGPDSTQFKATAKLGEFLEAQFSQSFSFLAVPAGPPHRLRKEAWLPLVMKSRSNLARGYRWRDREMAERVLELDNWPNCAHENSWVRWDIASIAGD